MRQAVLAFFLLAAATVWHPGVNAKQPSTQTPAIKIGFLAPLSGPTAVEGREMVQGVELFLDETHHRMAGRPVEVLEQNDESNPATAIQLFRKLVNQDKVSIVAGEYLTNVAEPLVPLSQECKTPLVLTVASGDELTQQKRSPWCIRISGSCSQNFPFGEYTFKTLGYKKVVTVAMDYAYGWEMVADFQKSYEAAGGKVIQKLWLPVGYVDFSKQLKSIRRDADAVYLCTIGRSCKIVVNEYGELGFTLPLFGSGSAFEDDLLPEIGPAVTGAVSSYPYTAALDIPENRRFVEKYKAKYGRAPNYKSVQGYMTMMWIAKALDALHGDVSDSNKLLAALRSVEFKSSPKGPQKLDGFGNVVENIYVRKVTEEHGHFQNKVISTFPMVSQFWKYNEQELLDNPPATRDSAPCRYCSTP